MRLGGIVICLLAAVAVGCGGGGGGGKSGGGGGVREGAPLVLAAGANPLGAAAVADWAADVDVERLGLSRVDAAYDLSTPVGESFAFDIVSRNERNAGSVRVSLAHAEDDGWVPFGGVESISEAGILPSASGSSSRADWLDAHGDGFARISIRGEIEREQILAVETEGETGSTTALVRIRPGPESEINTKGQSGTDYPGALDDQTLYSSNSWRFGLPTIAVSGDRTSIVCYEGDRLDPDNFARYEMRLQHAGLTGEVTGGASVEAGDDFGNWRDHEIAALYNVLALVTSGSDRVTLKLSFDRGATFAQTESLGNSTRGYWPRLVQIAMAEDYSLAVAWWAVNASGSTDLMLVTGRPSETDGDGSPTRFELDPPEIVYRDASDVTPMLFGMDWSEGGDLAIAYAFTRFLSRRDGTWENVTLTRVAVRPWNGEFTDTLVDEERIIGRDPSVSLVGRDAGLRVFCAYESSDGVRLRVSGDAGKTYGPAVGIGDESSHTPTVLARTQGGVTRVDVLYLTQGEQGQELWLRHWDDYDAGAFEDHRLTTAKWTATKDLPRDAPVPGADVGAFVPDAGFRITQVAWLGYDAVLDGDDVVVVYDEETFDAWTICFGGPGYLQEFDGRGAPAPAAGGEFQAAEPPPLAPGLTEPVAPPDPDHMHQLRLLRLD